MGLPESPAGWTRFLVKSKFAVGRDFAVLDPATEKQVYFIDGKLGVRPQAEVKDANDAVIYRARGSMMGIPKQLTISDASGTDVAFLKAKMFSPVRSQMTITNASGETWDLVGSLMEKEYNVTADGRPVIQISQKWLAMRDTFTIDIANGVDPGLVLAVMWGVSTFAEAR